MDKSFRIKHYRALFELAPDAMITIDCGGRILETNCGLQRLVEALDTDRANLGQIDQLTGEILVTHAYAGPGIPPFGQRIAKTPIPWYMEQIRLGRIVKVNTLDELPEQVIRECEYATPYDSKSILAVPIRVVGKVVGGISTGAYREHH